MPRWARDFERGYALENEVIHMFYCNKEDSQVIPLEHFIVPNEAVSIKFRKMKIGEVFVAGEPSYYDSRGNLLKRGNH